MVGIAVVTRAALLIARRASTWTIDEHLGGRSPECVAVDQRRPAQVYCGTARAGLFRSRDSGWNWEPAGPGIDRSMVTAVDVGHARQADGFGIVYAGTEPSAVFRSDIGERVVVFTFEVGVTRMLPDQVTSSCKNGHALACKQRAA
jgi:hypothetical protein